jgi:phosphoribosylaminoimidazole-succinocarboxamide synthase
MTTALLQSDCPELELVARGKVRDLYKVDEEHLLFVASDRISAFDVVMDTPIPGKGRILTQLSLFWFEQLAALGPNHLVSADIAEMPAAVRRYEDQLRGRSMLVRRLEILPVEAIVRGYITGSGWKEYRQRGTVCDIQLPQGLQESERLAEPLYTPSTKAEQGAHDENIHPDKAAEILGPERAAAVASRAIALYATARDYAAGKGIIIADTKFEFGVDQQGQIVLADEVLTPDSSRFWPADRYATGRGQDSFDKQYLRDYLESIGFDKSSAVTLPEAVVAETQQKYIEAFRILTGRAPQL